MQRIAVMQPYTFPYLGYFQLIHAVDTFVFFDDVQYIRRGFINRNSILVNGKANRFVIPVVKGSRNDLITQTLIHKDLYVKWRGKFFKSIELNYKKAPHFKIIYNMVEELLSNDYVKISSLAKGSIKSVCNYLMLDRDFKDASSLDYDRNGNGQDKIIDICSKLKATSYVNPVKGKDLYSRQAFDDKSIKLSFLNANLSVYNQAQHSFQSHLSIIDVLMWLSPEQIQDHLESYFITRK